MTAATEFETANSTYSSTFSKGDLALPPARKVAVVVCMDARIDPAAALGLSEGDAHVIRNAGGRSSDALRSVIILQRLLGTKEIVVVHHTDCGMLTFSDTDLRGIVKEQTGHSVDHVAFLPFKDLEESVREDVEFFRKSPLVLDVPVTGYIYDVKTGRIDKVE
ncbi:putative carbonic anhydrase [Suhomyces tanzawaensis NRRL Y-17324]|uniref:Carbonic anhydrase n=1 Tax=Suhomyces tanzawaensis NRRL Y-17324 TaxID=984487 RepID=A0A1E4SRM7_9ASCO|nr:putative carbonic anhydrase [Suhomyces tanzawaensis NRRL Y-17324]ODV82166.1 putative carbonic anhydrase [Suhomyces tanzawaensis NRRL Y-17324]